MPQSRLAAVDQRGVVGDGGDVGVGAAKKIEEAEGGVVSGLCADGGEGKVGLDRGGLVGGLGEVEAEAAAGFGGAPGCWGVEGD